jgi:aminomethyltransferase
LEKGIGLGYVPTELSEIGMELDILIRGENHKAVIVKPPFWKNYTHK